MIRVALDAMGGDYAPDEMIRGGVSATAEGRAYIILVGDTGVIEQKLSELNSLHLLDSGALSIFHAAEVVEMGEAPVTALRKKKDASISVATRLVKEGNAEAVVSAGSTGAQMASALLGLGRIRGIHRPAIATLLPSLKGPKLLLDAGANVDCKPNHLVQFAQMGSLYAERVMGITNPRVGLLNIGVEKGKGNELTLATYDLLESSNLNFIGNVEGRDIPQGNVDVVTCDGFVGNTLLKFGEGLVTVFLGRFYNELSRTISSNHDRGLDLSSLIGIKKELDYHEYGGAPLMGVKGVSIVCHGSSNSLAVKNAIGLACNCVENRLIECLSTLELEESVDEC